MIRVLEVVSFALLAATLLLIALVFFANSSCHSHSTRRPSAAMSKMAEFRAKLEVYRMVSGQYPTEAQGLAALVTKPTTEPIPDRWKQQFKTLPMDPWMSPYIYKLHAGPTPDEPSIELISIGPDRVHGTDDDISSLDLDP